MIAPNQIEAVATAMLADLKDGDAHGCRVIETTSDHQAVVDGHVDLRSLARAVLAVVAGTSPPSTTDAPAVGHDGWLFNNLDAGVEWSEQHPVESGHAPDAEDIRPATIAELKEVLFAAWHEIAQMERDAEKAADAPSPAPDAAPVDPVAGDGWETMETAPKDGTPLRVLYEDGSEEDDVYWQDEGRCCMLGSRAGAMGPGWTSTIAGNLPVDDPIGWKHLPFPDASRSRQEGSDAR